MHAVLEDPEWSDLERIFNNRGLEARIGRVMREN